METSPGLKALVGQCVDSLLPHGLQYAGFLCPWLSPGVCSHVHWVSDAIQSFHPLLPPSPPAFNLCQHQGLFHWVSSSHRWPKYWNFSISPSNIYSGLISFRTDWFDLPAIQRDSQDFSIAPQSQSPNSTCPPLILAFLFLLSPPLQNNVICLQCVI